MNKADIYKSLYEILELLNVSKPTSEVVKIIKHRSDIYKELVSKTSQLSILALEKNDISRRLYHIVNVNARITKCECADFCYWLTVAL